MTESRCSATRPLVTDLADAIDRGQLVLHYQLTASATPGDRIAAVEAGADDYLVEPFAPRDLVNRVHSAERRRGETR